MSAAKFVSYDVIIYSGTGHGTLPGNKVESQQVNAHKSGTLWCAKTGAIPGEEMQISRDHRDRFYSLFEEIFFSSFFETECRQLCYVTSLRILNLEFHFFRFPSGVRKIFNIFFIYPSLTTAITQKMHNVLKRILNQLVHGKYNLISVYFNKISKSVSANFSMYISSHFVPATTTLTVQFYDY